MKNILLPLFVVLSLLSSQTVLAEDCLPCKGKINNSIMRYDGDSRAYVTVVTRKGVELFSSRLAPFATFTLSGADNVFGKKRTLGPAISIYVDGVLNAEFHTSCSEPFGPGTTDGDFVVISATSRNNGLTCPVGPIPPLPPIGE